MNEIWVIEKKNDDGTWEPLHDESCTETGTMSTNRDHLESFMERMNQYGKIKGTFRTRKYIDYGEDITYVNYKKEISKILSDIVEFSSTMHDKDRYELFVKLQEYAREFLNGDEK